MEERYVEEPRWGIPLGSGGTASTCGDVYDANGKLVGPLVGIEKINGKDVGLAVITTPGQNFQKYFINVTTQGFINTDARVYFASANCTFGGFLPYDPAVEILPHAIFNGGVFGPQINQWGGYEVGSYLQNQACTQLPAGSTIVGAPVHPFLLIQHPGPFSVK